MTIAPDGTEQVIGYNGVSSTTQNVTWGGSSLTGTAFVYAVIGFTVLGTTPATVTSITDGNGNTWQRYTSQSAGSAWDTTQTVNAAQKGFTLEVWYTKDATIGAGALAITINHSGTIDAAVACFSPKLTGYVSAQPFDQNASMPKVLRVNASAAETLTGISTDTAHIWPCWAFCAWGTNLGVSNPTFNSVSRNNIVSLQKNASEFVKAQMACGPAASSAYAAVSFSSPTSASNFFLIGFALTSDVQAGPVVAQPIIVIMQ